MSNQLFQAGDIILTTQTERGQGIFGKVISALIAWASTMPGEARSRATHAAIVVRTGTLQTAQILEALWPQVIISPLSKYAGGMVIYRPIGVKPLLLAQMANMARRHAHLTGGRKRGVIYGLFKLLLFLGDSLLSKGLCWLWRFVCFLIPGLTYKPFEVRIFTRLNLIWSFVCSQVVARVYGEIIGWSFGYHWTRVNPDDIDDYCGSHPQQFKQIYPES